MIQTWIDVETTGLNSALHDIVELACVIVDDGIIIDSFNEYCQPINYASIDLEALIINHRTIDELKTFQTSAKMLNNLISFLDKHNVNNSIMSGYNVKFDRGFVASFFEKNNKDTLFTKYFNSNTHCTFERAKSIKTSLKLENAKLGTLCKHFNVTIDAHNALSDILATIEVDRYIKSIIGDIDVKTSMYSVKCLNIPEPAQLHMHTMYSHFDSINSYKDIIKWGLLNKIPAIATPDHCSGVSLYESVNLDNIIKQINKENNTKYTTDQITPIPAVSVYTEYDGVHFFINAWATSNEGYYNLVKLSSAGWDNLYNDSGVEYPLVNFNSIIDLKKDVIFGLPGMNGPIKQLIVDSNFNKINDMLDFLCTTIDVRLELAAIDTHKFFHEDFGFLAYNVEDNNLQKVINNTYYKYSLNSGIKCVVVSDSHFLDKNDKIIQDCSSKNAFKDSRYFYESRHQLLNDEMYAILSSHIPSLGEVQYLELVNNNNEIAFLAKNIKIKYEYRLPIIDIPNNIKDRSSDYNEQTYLYMMQKIQQHGRWNNSQLYIDRFKREIDVIMKNSTLNFIPYFLMYEDICTFARSKNLLQNIARGSAGGSLISFYLKVIHVDPIEANLPFERFLSHARIKAGSFPDIDLDLPDRARPFVMRYLKEKYDFGFAQMATFSKMKTKNAIKDAMMALYGRNRNDPEIKAICDSIPDSPQGVDEIDFLYGYVDQEGEEHKGAIDTNPMLSNFFNARPQVQSMVDRMVGLIRGWSRHASAFVISTYNLPDCGVPMMIMNDKDIGPIAVTQLDALRVEKCGLIKADILGIKTLSMVSDCIDLVKKNKNIDLLDELNGVPLVYRLPEEDKVFVDIYNKNTDSSFQFSTSLVKGYVKEFIPTKKAHLHIMTALLRPGALDAPLFDTTAAQYYMDVRNGKRDMEFLHEDLRPIIGETNAVFTYQEQIMQFLVEIVGYSWEESDTIRSAIAKKKHEVIMGTFDRIRKSCSARGWTHDAIETICQQIQAFSKYSFNKSHSYAYGELGYITLYLKNQYPLEWWCSVLNSEDDNDKVRQYMSHLSGKIAPPSIKNPSNVFQIIDNKIIAPISAIKGIGPAIVNEIVEKAPYSSLEDFVSRINHTKCNIGAVGTLLKGRVFDEMLDLSSNEYLKGRQIFMDRYVKLRKIKTSFKPEVYNANYLDLFLHEREVNTCFNKTLLSIPEILSILKKKWNGLQITGNQFLPLTIGTDDNNRVVVVDSVQTCSKILSNQQANKADVQSFGAILLFEESSFARGISKKNGRPWSKVGIMLSDGYQTIECVDWNGHKALNWPKNSLVFVVGKISNGWKTNVSMNISSVEKIQ